MFSSSGKFSSRVMLTTALVTASTMCLVPQAGAADYTLPSGSSVVGGSAAVSSPSTGVLDVNQATDRVVINWDSFNIGTDASVRFFQPATSSLAVNRVVGAGVDPTRILGHLQANGQVMVLDRNGVLFGPSSTVDVGGLIASTGDVNTASVMAGDPVLTLNNFGTGIVENRGLISAADSGLVAFVGPVVKNSGIIQAKLGKVALAAGNETATVDLYGDGLVELAYTDKNDNLLSENTGQILAESGKIKMTAAAAKDIVDSVVNMDGVANANSASLVNGKIILGAKTVKVGSAAVVKGDTEITGQRADLDATIDGPVAGDVQTVNILSDHAKIMQGHDIVSTGGTINIAAGTYNEDLVLDKAGVTVSGAFAGVDGADASRGGVGETVLTPHSPGIVVIADGVTVDGVFITGADNGIEILSADNVTIKNSIVTSSSDNGIYILGSNLTDVRNNFIDGTVYDGIYALNSHAVTLADNTIDHSGLLGIPNERGNGILMSHASDSFITGNDITGSLWDAIKAVYSDNLTVSGNYSHEVTRAGVSVENSVNAVIDNNLLVNLGMFGIWSEKNLSAQITDNMIDDAGNSFGIFHNYGHNSVISGNIVTAADIYGIYVRNTSNLDILNNNIDHTGSDGIWVRDSHAVTLAGNTIDHSGLLGIPNEKGNGILLSNTSDSFITGNDITGSLWDAIKAVYSDNLTVSGNYSHEVTRAGVSVENSVNAVIDNNLLVNLGMFGIWSEKNLSAQITDNMIDDAGNSFGIFHNYGHNSVISGNIVTAADQYGLYVRNTSNLNILGNTFSNSGLDGIYIDNPSDNYQVSANHIDHFSGNGIRILAKRDPLSIQIDGNTVDNSGSAGTSGIYLNVGGAGQVAVSNNNIANNLQYGLLAYSGVIDLSSGINRIENTDTGMGFYANGKDPSTLKLAGNTIGNARFVDQTSLFVDLGADTFFAPGFPTLIDGMNATYTLGAVTINPSVFGFVTAPQAATLEAMINHYNDTPDRGLFSFPIGVVPIIVPLALTVEQSDVFRPLNFTVPSQNSGSLRITGLPRISGARVPGQPPVNFNDISPAAGGDSENTGQEENEDLAQLEPAAGGAGAAQGADAACWEDASRELGQGNEVNYNLGVDQRELLNNVLKCGSAQ